MIRPFLIRALPVLSLTALWALTSSASAAEVDVTVFKPALKSTWDQPRSEVDNARVELGKILYFEKRLSKDGTISCNSCHDLAAFGVDGKPFSEGVGGQLGGRNSPTSLNAFMHMTQFWDGRATTVEHQAKGPVLNPVEMAMPDEASVVKVLKTIQGYDALFAAAFPEDEDPVSFNNMATAIGAFERLLATPTRYDDYLNGDKDALTAREKLGLAAFVKNGCTTCHNSTLLGGNSYQKTGLVKPWPNQKDPGRFEVTQQEADRMMFKVPSLRNVEKTAPYFHDSTTTDLKEAITRMGKHQLGLEIPVNEVDSIVAFLKTLTGTLPAELTSPPTMPDQIEASGGDDFE